MLTECLPASPPSEDPVRDLANNAVSESPSQDWTGHRSVYKSVLSRERHLQGFESPPQRDQCCLDKEVKQEVALLLTELEMRVVSPLKAQELSSTGLLQTLTISPEIEEVSKVKLSERPLLVLFKEKKTAREAYELLYSLLESSKPVPKPRVISSQHPDQQRSLLEALRRGIETGDSILKLQRTAEIKRIPKVKESSVSSPLESSESDISVDPPVSASRLRRSEDVRHSTFKRLDSLEETIRELENTLIEISGHPAPYTRTTTPSQRPACLTSEKKPPVPPKPSPTSPASIQV